MQEIDISIVFPSRSRTHLLTKTLNSAFELASNPHRIEFVIVIDSDCPESRDFLHYYKVKHPERNIKVLVNQVTPEERKVGINIHERGFCVATKNSSGSFVLSGGNDIEFLTNSWDTTIVTAGKQFLMDKPDQLMYMHIKNDFLDPNRQSSSCFPLFSRAHCDEIGGTQVKEITSWGADLAMYEIYSSLIESRILRLEGLVNLIHHSYHTGRSYVAVGDHVAYNLNTSVLTLTQSQKQFYIDKLNNRILRFKK